MSLTNLVQSVTWPRDGRILIFLLQEPPERRIFSDFTFLFSYSWKKSYVIDILELPWRETLWKRKQDLTTRLIQYHIPLEHEVPYYEIIGFKRNFSLY